ncbi:MAG TPA: hypothetical protein VMN60_07230 [Longimicrobiales bacterium]|nr:hypothetical protein [Longimicrobiales bacterium]
MILYLSFEELAALNTSASDVLADNAAGTHGVVAPPQVIAEIEQVLPLLVGDVGLRSLDDQRRMQHAVRYLTIHARRQMERAVIEEHPAAEPAIAAYFIYAQLLTVANRLDAIGAEMAAVIKLLTHEQPDSEAARRFTFPD